MSRAHRHRPGVTVSIVLFNTCPQNKGAPTEADAPFSEDLLLGPLHVVYGCRVWLLNPAFAASGLEL